MKRLLLRATGEVGAIVGWDVAIGPIDSAQPGFRHTLGRLLCEPREPSPVAQALLGLGSAAYVADKTFARGEASDGWTREIKVSVPGRELIEAGLPPLEEALRFVSGDMWWLEGRRGEVRVGARSKFPGGFEAEAVCLFSGGTDSLCGAIDLLEEGRRTLLVSHFGSGVDAGVQRDLAAALCGEYGDLVRQVGVKVTSGGGSESSTRARSFLFVMLGLNYAEVFGAEVPLLIPENGFVGVNVALSGSRQGSYSTRTTHAYYMGRLMAGVDAVGVRNRITNPFVGLSKGRVMETCASGEMLRQMLPRTVSCAKPDLARWRGERPGRNCGACYPCLVRRAAAHRVGIDSPADYVLDALGDAAVLETAATGRDLRSVLQAVARYEADPALVLQDVLRTGPIGGGSELDGAIGAVRDGMGELRELVAAKGCDEVRRYAGV